MKAQIININSKFLLFGIAIFYLLCLIFALYFENVLIAFLPFSILFIFFLALDIELPIKLLYLTVPLSVPLGGILPMEIDFPSELFQLISTALFIFYGIMHSTYFTKDFFKSPLVVLILLSLLWLIICTLFSTDVAHSVRYTVKKIWYIIPFLFFSYVFFQKREHIYLAFKLIFIPLFLIVIMVMYKAKGVGFSFEDVHDPIQPFFRNHVIYGSMISSFFFLIFCAFLLNKKNKKYSYFFAFSLLLFFAASYFSYSRAAWAAIFFGLGIMLCIRLKIVQWFFSAFYVIMLVLVIWLGTNNNYLKYRPKLDKTVMHENLQEHLLATLQGTDISSAERYYRWIAAVRMSKDYPLFGVGPNNFYQNYKPYTITEFRTWVSRNLEESTTHNYFLFMLVEQGYIGMLLYGTLIFMLFYYGQKLYFNEKDSKNRIIVISVLGMLGAIFVNNFFSELLETDKIGMLFYGAIALLLSMAKDLNVNKSNI